MTPDQLATIDAGRLLANDARKRLEAAKARGGVELHMALPEIDLILYFADLAIGVFEAKAAAYAEGLAAGKAAHAAKGCGG